MLEFIDKIVIPFLASLYGWLGYGGVMVAMAIESAMIPLPSELILPFAGFLVSDPTAVEPLTHGAWDFWLVVIAATIGNTIGSVIGYFIGAWGGRPFLERWGKYLLIRPHELDRAHDWFERYGEAAVFFSRLLPVIRTFISLPAGVVRMNFGTFTLYTVLGCLPWTFALAWLGYELGDRWETVDRIMRPISLVLAVAFAAFAAWFVVHRIRRIRAETAAATGPRDVPADVDQDAASSESIVHEPPTSSTSTKPSDR